jgi:hypothetical protein
LLIAVGGLLAVLDKRYRRYSTNTKTVATNASAKA